MIFNEEYIVFEILDVLFLEQPCKKSYNSGRDFDALSFRFETDTIMETNDKQIKLKDNVVCYVPSNVGYTRMSGKDKLIVVHFKTFNYHSENIEYFYPDEPQKYQELFNEILKIRNTMEVSYKCECAAVLNKIFAQLYKDNHSIVINPKIYNAVVYIDKNCLDKEFSLSEAAKQSFISDVYFRKLFKEEYKITPKQYVINRRTEHAKALIIAGYFTISEISEMCGYKDSKHFSTEFKAIVGSSPSKYGYDFKENKRT